MDRYEKKLFWYILRISNVSKEEAEDILQDVFIKIYQNLNGFDPELKFSSWAYRITHNQVISNFRKADARPKSIAVNDQDDIFEHLASDLNLEEETDKKLLAENIKACLQTLDVKYREVLVLKFLEEKSYEEISDIIKKPMGTIAIMINRAKKKFKESYAEKFK